MTQALDIITNAHIDIGALAPGEPLEAASAAFALTTLNDMLDQWSNDDMMVFNINEIIFTLTPGQYVYTLGAGGQINTTRPLGIDSAFVRVNTLDYPVAIIDINQYEMIGLKSLNGPWPRALYYNSGVPLGTATFWPNPSSGEIHMFAQTLFTGFANISDTVTLPQGYNMALRWNLAELLMPSFGKSDPVQSAMIVKNAANGRALIKRTNMRPQQVARFPSILNSSNAKDAGWILNGGFA
jgi:hypothetical protein